MGLWGVLRTVLLVGIVMAAVTLTGLRLVGSDDGLAVMVTAFAPYGLLLWAAVLGHAAFRTITGPRRVLWSVAAALVVLPLALHGWWLAPSYVGAQPDAATGATSFRLMTANLLAGRGDGAELLASAVREDVDVLVVEEVDEAALALMESAGLDSAFPHRAGEPGTALEGTMIFSAYPLSDTAEVPVSLGGWATTAATPDGPVRVLGAHTHPPSITLGYAGSDHAILREAAAGADVVTGDLNATPDTGPMLRLDDDGVALGRRGRQRGLAADLAGVRQPPPARHPPPAPGPDRPRARA
jgi:endonuclease/exonuclease/phosphatase (EEP) superfamily protein YafD